MHIGTPIAGAIRSAVNRTTIVAEYSAFSLLKNALSGNRDWKPAWRAAVPKPRYDVIIVGGGGHGLATAYYLAKEHGITNVAVVERGYIGGGNVGRNTTIVRSNYMLPANSHFYEWSMKLWEGLSRDLNYNVMFSQRGVLNLAHSPAQMDAYARRGNAMRVAGIDSDLLTREQAVAEASRCLACGCGAGCEVCKDICKMFSYEMDANGRMILDEEQCVACGMCIWRCPNKNVEMIQTGTENLV